MDLKKQPITTPTAVNNNNNINQESEGRVGISTITPFAMETAERYLTKKKDAQHKEYLLKFICAFLGLFASICFLLVVVLTYRNVQLESDNSELVGNLRQLSILLNAAVIQSQIDQGTMLFGQKQQEIMSHVEKMDRWLSSPENLLPLELQNDDWLTVPEEPQQNDEYDAFFKEIIPLEPSLSAPADNKKDEPTDDSKDSNGNYLSHTFLWPSPISMFYPMEFPEEVSSSETNEQAKKPDDDTSTKEDKEDESDEDSDTFDILSLFGFLANDNTDKIATPKSLSSEEQEEEDDGPLLFNGSLESESQEPIPPPNEEHEIIDSILEPPSIHHTPSFL